MKLSVPDMSCGHCKASVEKAVDGAGGQASVDLESRTVEVSGVSLEAALAALAKVGFPAQAA